MTTPAHNILQQADVARQRGDKAAARKLLEQSLALDSTLAGAWFGYAAMLDNPEERAGAIAASRRCLETALPEPYSITNMAMYLHNAGRPAEALPFLERALEMNEKAHIGWTWMSLAQNALRNPEEAIKAGRNAVKHGPTDMHSRLALAFALLMDGQWNEGLAEYEWRFQYKMPEFLRYPLPRWDGGSVKTLFIPSEQGAGDTIQFARFIALAAKVCRKVIVAVSEDMESLTAYAKWPHNVETVRIPCAVPEADAFCPLMSLPAVLGLGDKEIPTVEAAWFAPPERRWPPHAASGPATTRKKVGIAWAGSPEQDNDHNRSSTIEAFLGLYAARGIQLYSFQVGDRGREARRYGPLIKDVTKHIRTFEDTATYLQEMDAVVTVCTSVAHLAGALDIPTHIVLPRQGQHFVWGHSGLTTPWYPSVRLYRQERAWDWGSVIANVAEAL